MGVCRSHTLEARTTGYVRCSPPVKVIRKNSRLVDRGQLRHTDMLAQSKRDQPTNKQTKKLESSWAGANEMYGRREGTQRHTF